MKRIFQIYREYQRIREIPALKDWPLYEENEMEYNIEPLKRQAQL